MTNSLVLAQLSDQVFAEELHIPVVVNKVGKVGIWPIRRNWCVVRLICKKESLELLDRVRDVNGNKLEPKQDFFIRVPEQDAQKVVKDLSVILVVGVHNPDMYWPKERGGFVPLEFLRIEASR